MAPSQTRQVLQTLVSKFAKTNTANIDTVAVLTTKMTMKKKFMKMGNKNNLTTMMTMPQITLIIVKWMIVQLLTLPVIATDSGCLNLKILKMNRNSIA